MAPGSAHFEARYRATIDPCPPAGDLEPIWRALEDQADSSVFLSWAWIGSLLSVTKAEMSLARICCGEQLVGLALLGRGKTSRRFFGAAPSLYLNETGDSATDRVMVEYNGVLAAKGEEANAGASLVAALCEQGAASWRDVTLSGVPAAWSEICQSQGLAWRLLRQRQSAPFADLARMDPDDPVRSLSRNSREQIRRSIRFFEEIGPLSLARATDAEQALGRFDELERLHTASWVAKGKAGAFADPCFRAFHRHLIASSFSQGVPELLCLRAGDRILGYLYNLRWRGVAYSYQSGFLYGEDPRWRPGLVAHAMALRHYGREGVGLYRFLAGGDRYKASLSNGADELCWMQAYRPGVFRSIEQGARDLRQALRDMLKGRS